MQNITDSEFQREVEVLKAHRRTSVNRPLLDPDLPETAAAHGGGRELLGSDESGHLSTSGSQISRGSLKGVNLSDEGPLPRTPNQTRDAAPGRTPFTARRRGADAVAQRQLSASGRSNNEIFSSSAATVPATSNDDTPLIRPLDPSHLFWVPASVHPEISPSDFRKFLHDHTSRAVKEQQEQEQQSLAIDTGSGSNTDSTGSNNGRQVSPHSLGLVPQSISPPASPTSPVEALKNRSTSIARKGSILRRQYRPENDNDEEVSPFAAIKGRSPIMQRVGSNWQYGGSPTLSIDELQQLEQLAEEASKSSDPTELRSVLRRTMSLNMTPSTLDQVDALPAENEQDAPLIVPRPGQILRRAARTKIRKASFSSEGEASQANRLSRRRGGAGSPSHRTFSDGMYESMDGDSDVPQPLHKRQSDNSDISEEDSLKTTWEGHPSNFADSRTSLISLPEGLASSTGDENSATSIKSLSQDPQTPTQQSVSQIGNSYFDRDSYRKSTTSPSKGFDRDAKEDVSSSSLSSKQSSGIEEDVPTNTIRPVHVQHIAPLPAFEKTRPAPQPPVATPSTQKQVKQPIMPGYGIVKADTMPILPSNSREQGPIGVRPLKEKKMGFGLSWFGLGKEEEDKSTKKEKKERKERERDKEREAESATFNATSSESPSFLGSLFGKKKGSDESYRQEYSSSMYGQVGHLTAGSLLDARSRSAQGQSNYYRYPIHVERAVYRLSHIKLANPRRPLYEQVLISNLMFWYLSIINRSQQQQHQQQQSQSQLQSQSPSQQEQASIHQQQQQPTSPMIQSPPQNQSQQQQPVQSLQQHPSQNKAESIPSQLSQSTNVSSQKSYLQGNDKMAVGEENFARESEVANEDPHSNGLMQDHAATNSSLESVSGQNTTMPISSNKPAVPKQKRGGLVKPNRAPPGTRSTAETAIPAAAYGAQHRQINSELANSSNSSTSQSNGYTGMMPSLTVGQIVQPRTMAAYSMGLYEHHGMNNNSSGGDEHTWLGSRERRANVNTEERKGEGLNENTNQYREASSGYQRKMYNRVNESTKVEEDGINRRSNPTSLQRGSGDSSNFDTLTSSPSTRSFASNTTVSSSDHGNQDKLISLMEAAPSSDLSQIQSIAGNKDEASVLLEAARSSQSRRR